MRTNQISLERQQIQILALKVPKWRLIMKSMRLIITGAFLIILLLTSGCSGRPLKPEGTLTPDELLQNPVYNQTVRVYGPVSGLGDFMCPCLLLRSDGETLHVWYDTMVEDNGTLQPAVNVQEINNGDWVIVTGEFKSGEVHYSLNDFWVSSIEIISK